MTEAEALDEAAKAAGWGGPMLDESIRAELVEEIVAWLDDPAGDWPRATSPAANLAHQIKAKFGGRDG